MLSYCHKLFAFAHTETVCLCLSDSCSDHWGPAVVWQQHQTGGEGQCVWRHPQDKDQEGKQPLLWRGTLNSYTVRRYTIQFYNKMFYNTFLMESKFVPFDLIGLAFNIFSFCLSSLKLWFFFDYFWFLQMFFYNVHMLPSDLFDKHISFRVSTRILILRPYHLSVRINV